MARLNYLVSNEVLNTYNKTKLRALIDEFMESGADIAEVLYAEGEYSKPSTLGNCLYLHIRKRMLPVRVMVRKGRVYLARKEI